MRKGIRSVFVAMVSVASLGGCAVLECVVRGTPVDFPDDIAITNESNNVTVSTGTTIEWKLQDPIPNDPPAFECEHILTADLAPSEGVFVLGVLPGGQEAGTECEAVVKPSS